ncbi:hypothetical protein M0805_005983 [Coniferiporia weirii]|nr:hypothetical protein M0805_005983 [Coniferiporia weirii]
MARRANTESEESSQNIDERPVKMRSAKRTQPVEEGRRANATAEHEDGVQEEEEEEEEESGAQESAVASDQDEDGENGAAGGSPKGVKRVRVNDEGEGISVKNERRRAARPVALQRDANGYVPGSIVRVKLHQFLTYDDVEFRPGPYLNMVLGPNGTGKSSIACALCLGLNWPPSVLGRATKLGAFVKQGFPDGFIEIELKGPIGEQNLVIRRLLNETMGKQASFTLNGEQASGKVISEHVEGLGIQVNNLCSFLPQDKVAEFAQMSPQQLLRATQKAAGDERLIGWHDYLITAGKELAQHTSAVNAERSELGTLEQRNATLEKEVQAYQQRREIEQKIELLELILPFKEYIDARAEYDRLKRSREELHERVTALKQRNQPVLDFKETLEKQHKKAEKERERCKASAKTRFESMKALWKDNNELQTKSELISENLTTLRAQEKQRREKILNLKKEIHRIENEIAHPPEMEDLNEIEADRKKNSQALDTAERAKHELEEAIRPYVDEEARQNVRIERATNDLKRLDDAAHRRLDALLKWDKDVGEVVRWLRNNGHRFKMEVIEPACLSLDVKDSRFSDAIEGAFSVTQLKTFVFQCQEDYKLFNSLICDSTEGMGKKVRVATWFRQIRPETIRPPPMTVEELHEQGFDAYGIDCVTYPPGMLMFLQDLIQLHRYAIALNPGKVDVGRAMEMVSRGSNANFVVGHVLSQVTRSRYGQRKPQNLTRDLRRAQSFNIPPVDQDRKRALEGAVAEAKQLLMEAEAEIKKIGHQIHEAGETIKDINKQKSDIEARKKAVREVERKLQSLHIKLGQKRQTLDIEESAPSADETRNKLRQEGFEIARKRANIVKQLQEIIREVIQDNTRASVVGLKYLQIGANKIALEELVRTHNVEYNEAAQAYQAISNEFTKMKDITKEKLRISRAKLEEIDDELRTTFMAMEESGSINSRDCEDIQQELENLRAQLSLNLATNAGVIEQYEKRKRDIDRLRVKVEEREATKAKTERKIQKTKDRWLPALQELIANIGEKFSAAFDRVYCAGEIKLTEHAEDYAAWAIDILVKFRDTEELQLLTGQRQSGGERALTTIMYLMSLTELARAPFSLVDEINQGMDARYERAVHNSLVEVTCQPDSGQYFLITPKLLTDLKYHERMKVLCVSNGEWLPEERLSGNMMSMIDTFLARRTRAQ